MFNIMFNKSLEITLLLFKIDQIQKNVNFTKKYAESMLVMRIMEARSYHVQYCVQ